jgi:methylisocitrate lyase
MTGRTPGARLRDAVTTESPLQVVGCVNAYTAMLAKHVGFKAVYVSGAALAAGSLGVPDLAITTLHDVLTDTQRLTDATDLPVLVDADTGFGSAFNIARTVKSLIKAGAGGMHIEDQVAIKRCGHRPNKALVAGSEMVDRIRAAVDARTDPGFVIMARTDALSGEGLQAALDRACAYAEAGADMIFPEAVADLATYARFAKSPGRPVLANITEFGRTPLFTLDELRSAGVAMALYPTSAFRIMSAATLDLFETLRRTGTQKALIERMQTRDDLYGVLGYHDYEKRLDRLFAGEAKDQS